MPGPYYLSYNISAMQFEIRENYISSFVPSRDCFRYLRTFVVPYGASLVALTIKNLPAIWRLGFNLCIRKIPLQREWLSLQYSCLDNSRGRKPWDHKELDMTNAFTFMNFKLFFLTQIRMQIYLLRYVFFGQKSWPYIQLSREGILSEWMSLHRAHSYIPIITISPSTSSLNSDISMVLT